MKTILITIVLGLILLGGCGQISDEEYKECQTRYNCYMIGKEKCKDVTDSQEHINCIKEFEQNEEFKNCLKLFKECTGID